MPEWFDKAKEKTVSGYQSVRDSKATKIAGRQYWVQVVVW